MERDELRELWKHNKDRPAFVREYREEIHEHTDLSEPIPEGSLFEVRKWLDSYKGVVTRQIDDDSPGTDPQNAETTTTTDTE